MGFLDQFPNDEQLALRNCAEVVRLGPGAALFRQQDRSRDLYVLEDGVLEVVDTSGHSPIILRTFPKGELVGEISFLNEHAARTAEVRARDAVVLLRFDYARTNDFLRAHPGIAAKFYRLLAQSLAQRTKATNAMALANQSVRERRQFSAGAALEHDVDDLLRRVADLQGAIADGSAGAEAELHSALDTFVLRFAQRLEGGDDSELAESMEDVRARLRPLLARSRTVTACLRAPHAADAEVVRHVLAGNPRGEGELGRALDRWVLERPTFRSLRERDALLQQLLVELLPPTPPWNVGVFNPVSPGLGSAISRVLGVGGGNVWSMLDVQDAEVTASVHADFLAGSGGKVRHRGMVLDVLGIASGRLAAPPVPPAHLVVLDGLLEYLPDRLAYALVRVARGYVRAGGTLAVTWVDHDPVDARFLAQMLRWPLVRREGREVLRLLQDSGLEAARVLPVAPCGGVATANQPHASNVPNGDVRA